MSADRNLLFGVLALQMDFVSRDALIRAMNGWVLEKARPLGAILQEQGALSAEHHALLEALVQAHLKAHADDPQRSLAAVSSVGSVRRDLEAIADADVQASLAQVSAARRDDDPYATRATTAGVPTGSGLRFSILRPHAKGGLGEVFVARDEELRREVALKEIQEKHADHPESRSRFLLEAEVTGGLEHPGIVPVYGLGHYGDGRPFYAMRFIRGDSLKHAIDRFHKDKAALPAGERALRLRQLLGRFVDVCEAIAYAHSRGILHRDLKPGNVMLGKYGETLVVDWGLAKPLGQADPAGASEEGPLQPASASGSAATQLGSALGTPAYMSPEQAAGRLDVLGPASDVYGLGATLYCLLTGRAPFTGRSAGEVLASVQKGDFPPPQQVEPGAPPALQAICIKAMALRPEDRYPSAQALAQDIERWLADEPVTAWREPWRVRAGRWVRRHQTAVTATAAAALVALLLGGGGALFFQRQWAERRAELARQEARLRQGVEAAIEEVTKLEEKARWGEARAALAQAAGRLGEEGPPDLRARVERARQDLDLVARLDDIRLSRALVINGNLDFAGAARRYAAAFAEAGLAREGDDPGEAAGRVQASGVRGPLVAALDDWACCVQDFAGRDWLLEVARKADPNPWRDRARQPATWGDRSALQELLAEEEAVDQSPQLVAALGNRLRNLGADPVGLLRRAQVRHPDDFWLNFELGRSQSLGQKGDLAETVSYYRAALALRPDSARVRSDLCYALHSQGKRQEAEEEYRAAIRLNPKEGPPHAFLALALEVQGKLQEAEEEYRAAIRLNPGYPFHHSNLGSLLYRQRKWHEAVEEYRAAMRIGDRSATLHMRLGMALHAEGKRQEAATEYGAAISLNPKLAPAHYGLGNLLKDAGRLEGAKQEYQQAIGLGNQGAAEELRQCDRLIPLAPRLSAVLRGLDQPANAEEMLGFAELCSLPFERRLRAATWFYSAAFAGDPKIAGDLKACHRYNAARCAALAGCGQGKDKDTLDDTEKALRRQALDWLQADLALWTKQAQGHQPADRALLQQMLRHWKEDTDLAGVRGDALARLPEAERGPWKKLWDDVDALLATVNAPKTKR